jgi:hypothetical protein
MINLLVIRLDTIELPHYVMKILLCPLPDVSITFTAAKFLLLLLFPRFARCSSTSQGSAYGHGASYHFYHSLL